MGEVPKILRRVYKVKKKLRVSVMSLPLSKASQK